MMWRCFPNYWHFVRESLCLPVDLQLRVPVLNNLNALFVVSLNKLLNKHWVVGNWDAVMLNWSHCSRVISFNKIQRSSWCQLCHHCQQWWQSWHYDDYLMAALEALAWLSQWQCSSQCDDFLDCWELIDLINHVKVIFITLDWWQFV